MRTFLILITLLGCDDKVGSTSTYDDYKKSAVKVFCEFYTRCGEYSKSREPDCESQVGEPQVGGNYSIDEAISAGRIAYDGDAAKSCLETFAGAHCDLNSLLTISQSSPCSQIVQPKVAVGGTCKSAVECVNSYCQQGTAVPGCAGTCVAYVATGGDCSMTGAHCAPTDACDTMTKTCVTLPQLGADCTTTNACAKGLSCRSNGSGKTCQAPGAENAACTSFTDCATGLYCDSSANLCKPLLAAGSACTSSSSCGDGTTCVGEATQMGTCQAYLDIGQSCTGTSSDSACAGDAKCDSTSHTCVVDGQEGSDCTTSSCGLNLYCNAQKKCAQKLSVGQACDTSSACASGFTCDATTKVCTAPMCK